MSNARWLKEHLQTALNISAVPLPVLTIPGWWVEAKAKEPIAALNPLTLAAALPARMAKTLTAAQSDQIVRNLAGLCLGMWTSIIRCRAGSLVFPSVTSGPAL